MTDTEYTWTDASALHQVQHGEHGTPRTESASEYLAGRLLEWDTITSTLIGRRLLEIVESLRADQAAAESARSSDRSELRDHVRELHPRITLRGQANDWADWMAQAHASDHHNHGSTTHHHGPNAGPHARPAGWRDGSGVVLIDRQAAMRRPDRTPPGNEE